MIGEKFIDGKMLNLDKELIDNLEGYARNIAEREENLKYDLDGFINKMMNE